MSIPIYFSDGINERAYELLRAIGEIVINRPSFILNFEIIRDKSTVAWLPNAATFLSIMNFKCARSATFLCLLITINNLVVLTYNFN